MAEPKKTEKKEFTSLDANGLNLSIANKYRESITPDAPITKKTISGAEFEKLIRFMDNDTLLKTYGECIMKGMKQSSSVNKLSNEYMEKFAPYFDKVEIQKSLDSVKYNIAVLYNGWYLTNNPTKSEVKPNNVPIAGVYECIARKTKADTIPNIINKIGGNFSYKTKDIDDMDNLEIIETELNKVLKKA